LFLDSDDCLEPTMLETLVGHLDRHPIAGVAYCAFMWVGQDDAAILANDPRLPDFLPTRYVPHGLGLRVLPASVPETPFLSIFGAWAGLLPSNALLRRSVYDRTSGWDEALGQPSEDTDVFLRMALQAEVHYVPRRLVRYRRHAAQSTTNRGRILSQDRKLFAKWARLDSLSAQDAARVQGARRFRETRILPYIAVRHGVSHLHAGNVVEGLKCFLRAGKIFATSEVKFTLADVRSHGPTRQRRAVPG
jgi:hypothetical protein